MKWQNQKRLVGTVVLILATMFTPISSMGGLVLAQKAREPSTNKALAGYPSPVGAHPFEPSEELIYVAEFSRALLKKIDIADFRFSARREPSLPKVNDGEFSQNKGGAAYLLKLTGDVSSKGFFSKLFNLRFREQIESIVEPVPFSVRKTKRIDQQGKRERVSQTTYGNGKIFWTEHDPNNPGSTPRQATATFAGQVQDVLSAIYYLRTQPLAIGKSLQLIISDSGHVYQVPVRVVEKRRMKTVLGRVEALRVDAEIYGRNRMIDADGQFSIWLTNDSRRIPVSARIKTEYGTFDITLRKVTQNPTARESLASTN